MIQFGWIEHGLVAFAFESPHNLWLHNLLNYTAIYYVLCRIWRSLHRDRETGRRTSEKLLKLGGGQKFFTFRERLQHEAGGKGELAILGRRSENFNFQGVGVGAYPMRGVNFLGSGSYPSAHYRCFIWSILTELWKILFLVYISCFQKYVLFHFQL